MTLFLNFPLILIGRLFLGIYGGVSNVISIRMIEESVPVHTLAFYGMFNGLALYAGQCAALFIGVILPTDTA
jgi:MFS family permease